MLESKFFLPPDLQGQRFDKVLAEFLPEYSRASLSSWIKEGKIRLNQVQVKAKEKVFGGEEVTLDSQALMQTRIHEDKPEFFALELIYEDEELLVINKPVGLVVHPGRGQREGTLLNALLYHHPLAQHLPRAGIIHRLDKETTGLMVIAKTLKAHTALVREMQAREIKRRYLTLVQGHLIAGGRIETFYGRDPKNRLKMAVLGSGREAITSYMVKKHYQIYTLLEVELFTGRTHQIRVHMAHIKHPVFGDPLYGGRLRYPKEAEADLLSLLQHFKRQALHAAYLSFTHPVSQEYLSFEAPLPDDFKCLLTSLDAYLDRNS